MLQYIDTQKKELCCGCRACEQICHVHAIIMKEDEEGFLYPHLNMNLCTQCGLCEKVCPISEPILVSSEIANMQVYAAMTRDVELRKVHPEDCFLKLHLLFSMRRVGYTEPHSIVNSD